MRTFKRLILFLFLLAVIGVLCAHWLAHSSAGVACVENRIKASTGFEAKVKSVHLGMSLRLIISDLRLTLKDETDIEKNVLVVPVVEVSGLCHRRKISLSRPVFTAFQSPLGHWTPSQLKEFVDSSSFWNSLSTLSGKLDRRFEITDGALVMKDSAGKELASYSGLSWYHAPAKIKGHPRLLHDVVSLQCINGQQVEFSGEWLSEGKGMYFIGPVPVEMTSCEDDEGDAVEAPAEVEVPAVAAPVESGQEVVSKIPEVGEKSEISVPVDVTNKSLDVK